MRVDYRAQGHFYMQAGGLRNWTTDFLISRSPTLPPELQQPLDMMARTWLFCPFLVWLFDIGGGMGLWILFSKINNRFLGYAHVEEVECCLSTTQQDCGLQHDMSTHCHVSLNPITVMVVQSGWSGGEVAEHTTMWPLLEHLSGCVTVSLDCLGSVFKEVQYPVAEFGRVEGRVLTPTC